MLAFENSSKRPAPQDIVENMNLTKKHKVEFSDQVTMFPSSDSDENGIKKSSIKVKINNNDSNQTTLGDEKFALDMYKRVVKSALDDLDKNDPTQINLISSQINLSAKDSDRISESNLSILLEVLSNNITKLDTSKANTIIQSIITLEKWWELPTAILSKYIYFIRILCSSIPKWWQDISMNLISNFILPNSSTSHHHDLLKYFLNVIPSSMNYIDSYLSKFFPNKNDTRKKLVNYISNILTLTSYCKELRFQTWSLLIERIISIDVELQNELDELDDDDEFAEDDAEEEDNDDDDDDEKDDDDDDMEEENDEEESNMNEEANSIAIMTNTPVDLDGDEEYDVELSQNIKELSNKLDSILTLISTRLGEELKPENLENGEGVSIFNTLTTLFKTHVLSTYYTKSIQYIMFHISQLQSELMDSFLVSLIDISFSPNETSEKKVKALQYLGSYIARAKKLSRTQIIFVASYLTSWLNRFVLEREYEVDMIANGDGSGGGMDRFKHFYAVFQSLCYMFCFRHELFKDQVTGQWECELDKFFQRLIVSKFNPLKYCNENVMLMFARITQHEGIAYCFSIIENNSNERLRGILGKPLDNTDGKSATNNTTVVGTTWSIVTRQQFIDLQSYFPYDPLFLKNYKNFMKQYYIEWSEVSGDYESDESDE
ncbi:hypothetical protein TBLA_0I01360 [Henningerozyma blattae CBS 6284]|uniref:RNA polymerase I-specific transcription initiation factor RRN3 n=1 Tax=Henningerozyma blattae (strain ATCC 34711 / CBS 6284 / DSM 70876 / NBRC 10599 / NRRL Y-10934 / UCD 77-7) TaxID=1071380 RepID=I2H8U4_HENB6|nr:hypothetical protein TBLA_0I01360 [Tetrapisispora blattae CBS 6284]CCH62796.1 hypothetical protein TBLA_0I01360 [Tetrapisispora blattae CBS 6284]